MEEHGSLRAAARALNMTYSTFHKHYNRALAAKADEPIPDFAFVPDSDTFGATHIGEHGVDTLDFTGRTDGVQRYIVTSAQNNCRVHAGFWRNLNALSEHLNAEIMVSFSIYDRQNYRGLVPKGEQKMRRQDLWWDGALKDHVLNSRARLARRLAFCGELDILATTKNPLSGLDSYCGRSSIIVPHNRFSFKCVESRKGQMPKELYTTGSVTERRFIQRKTGQVAHFHHVIGALLVEVDREGYFWVHHLNAEEDGSFQWLDKYITDGEVRDAASGVAGLILGDIHHEKLDVPTADITLQQIIPSLRPHKVVVHDLIDFSSRNHHNIKDPIFRVAKAGVKVEDELKGAAKFLRRLDMAARGNFPRAGVYNDVVHIIASNHDEALTRWVKETDWRYDPENAAFYLKVAQRLVWHAGEPGYDVFREAMEIAAGDMDAFFGMRFVGADDSLEIKGIECGMHGHIGPSGTRGSPRGFSRLGFKSFTAHTHTPSIVDGCYTVGVTGKLDMGYNRGPSKWMHCHGIIYNNGKRGFVFIKNGKWRA